MGRKLLAVAGTLDDDLVAGVGQPVKGAVAVNGFVKETEQFLHGPIGCGDVAEDAMPTDYELIQFSRPLGYEAEEAQVVDDWRVRG